MRGKGPLNAALTVTNAGGAYVATRYEIDSTLSVSWQQLGQAFTRWRIKSLTFHFSTLKSTSTEGNVGICVLTDPNEVTPSTTSSALGMQYSKFGPIRNNLSIRYRPPVSSWLFTRDAVGSTEDRIEMPGDVVYWTENTTASYVPGVPWVTYDLEFCSVSNAVVTPMKNKAPRDNVETSVKPEISQGKSEELTEPLGLAVQSEVAALKMQLHSILDKLGDLGL